MHRLAKALYVEQPRINAVCKREVEAMPELIRPVARHVLEAGGKRLRPLLAILVGRAFGCSHEDIYSLACAVEFFHVATLLHDDILDSAETRRGRAAAHTLYGPVVTTLAGDAMLANAAHMVARQGDTRLTCCFAEAIVQTAAGEVGEFTHQGNIMLPHAEYLAIITGKTAWPLRAACELAAIRSGAEDAEIEASARFGLELGRAFQMVDDALDILPEEKTGKPAGGDLRERKCTPVSRLYFDSLSGKDAGEFAQKFAGSGFSDEEIAGILAGMRAMNLDRTVRQMAETHLEAARECLESFPHGRDRDVLALIPGFIRDRDR